MSVKDLPKVDVDAITVRRRQVLDLRVQIFGCCVGSVVDTSVNGEGRWLRTLRRSLGLGGSVLVLLLVPLEVLDGLVLRVIFSGVGAWHGVCSRSSSILG